MPAGPWHVGVPAGARLDSARPAGRYSRSARTPRTERARRPSSGTNGRPPARTPEPGQDRVPDPARPAVRRPGRGRPTVPGPRPVAGAGATRVHLAPLPAPPEEGVREPDRGRLRRLAGRVRPALDLAADPGRVDRAGGGERVEPRDADGLDRRDQGPAGVPGGRRAAPV